MIGLDTNVLVRYITQDEPRQASRATRLIEQRCTPEAPGRISLVVMCELVRVLCGAYGYGKEEVAGVLEQILLTAAFEVEEESLAWQALDAWKAGKADYSDYLVVLSNRHAGCEATFTFDRKLARHPAADLP